MSKKSRFVTKAVTRLELSEDDWIEVKDSLSFGEQQKLSSAGFSGISGEDLFRAKRPEDLEKMTLNIDMGKVSAMRMHMYITDWSFTDDNDKRIPLSLDAILSLKPDTADEIEKALDAHVSSKESAKSDGPLP